MSTNENTAVEKLDVYAKVTSQIINAIELGVGNWKMPWHTSGRFASSPINATSRKAYRGINTSAAIAGASERSIMNQTGHRSVQMVRRYIRDGSLFRENSGGKLGL